MVGHIVKVRIAILLLSIGLAITYFYAAISALQSPDNWIAFLPEFLRSNPLAPMIMAGISIFQIFLAVWLVSGIRTSLAALVSLIMLAGILFANPTALDVTFRDFGLIFASLALAVLAKH